VEQDGASVHKPDNPTTIANGGFEDATGDRIAGWPMQDDPGLTTAQDRTVFHGGSASLRMEGIGRNANGLCRLAQPIKLQPRRQYLISIWVKTENLRPANPEVKVLSDGPYQSLSWQTFRAASTQ